MENGFLLFVTSYNFELLINSIFLIKFDNLFDVILGVIQSDARETIRPIWLETNTVEDIDNNYDGTITYGKVMAIQ